MIKGHEKAVPVFEKEADSGQNKLIQTYAENLAPVVKDHLAEAQTLDRDLFNHSQIEPAPTRTEWRSKPASGFLAKSPLA